MRDFPKPNCQSLQVPRLNEEMKSHIRKAGKDPHFGVERSLFRLQDQLLNAAGPLPVSRLNEQGYEGQSSGHHTTHSEGVGAFG